MTTEAPPPAIVSYETKVATIAAVLLAETGGEWSSMCAVAQVIANRRSAVKDCYAVVLERKQFSCLNRTTPEKLIYKWSTDVGGVASKARSLARLLLLVPRDVFNSDVGQATHYHSTKIKPPYWARGKKPLAKVSGHLFYKLP